MKGLAVHSCTCLNLKKLFRIKTLNVWKHSLAFSFLSLVFVTIYSFHKLQDGDGKMKERSPFKIQAQHFSRKAGLETRTTQTGSKLEGTQAQRPVPGRGRGVSADRGRGSAAGAAGPGPGRAASTCSGDGGNSCTILREYINTGNTDLYF